MTSPTAHEEAGGVLTAQEKTLSEFAGQLGIAPSTLALIRNQINSLVTEASKAGVPTSMLAELTGDSIRSLLEAGVRPGYATPEEGLDFLLNFEGGCVDVTEATRLFRKPDPVTRQSITHRIRNGEIVAYRTASGQYRIPRWQFRVEGGTVSGLAAVLAVLRKTPSFEQLLPFTFLLQPNPLTGGSTPLTDLREGNLDRVLEAAAAEVV